MTKPYTRITTRQTPQSQPILGSVQVANSAGGYSFKVDDWKQLDRFLILGTEGGTYYIGEHDLTLKNAKAVLRCIAADGRRVVARVVEISDQGRAPKNDPALFVLALAASKGNPETKASALAALPLVARIGTHLFHFAAYVEQFRGWGRGLRRAVAQWYTGREPLALAKQVTKYAKRDGWSHRDLLRLSHAKPATPEYNALFQYVVKGTLAGFLVNESPTATYLGYVESLKRATTPAEAIQLIVAGNLPREVVPTELLNEPTVWEALLPQMGLTALIRNLGTMAKIGFLTPLSTAEGVIVGKLGDAEQLKKQRVHPLQILLAQSVFAQGHGIRGGSSWTPTPRVIDALNDAFYASFDYVEPTGKRILLALDVSGSMSSGGIAGTPLTPREGSSAMAMVTARTETQYHIMAFSDKFMPLNISPKQRLDDIVRQTDRLPFMGTDCALPMLWALGFDFADSGYRSHLACTPSTTRRKPVEIDTFVVYTDSETWAGDIHPTQALTKYRETTGIPAKLVVVGMTSNKFTIADPQDAGMLDVVGFDASAPAVIADFIKE